MELGGAVEVEGVGVEGVEVKVLGVEMGRGG